MTYTDDDLTPWFPPDVKPVHEGVYQTRNLKGLLTFQYWNGKFWGLYRSRVDWASMSRNHTSIRQQNPWRGLSKQP